MNMMNGMTPMMRLKKKTTGSSRDGTRGNRSRSQHTKPTMTNYMFDDVILVDFDGVCVSWERPFAFWMLDNGYGMPRNDEYELHTKYGISETESRLITKMFNESSAMSRLPPLRDSVKYIRKLHEEYGKVFHCISAVPSLPSVYEARWKNIKALFGETPFERLILCDRSANKAEHLARYKDSGCLWVEDLMGNAIKGTELGLTSLLMDHKYNKDYSHPGVTRVQNWKDIYDIVSGEKILAT